MQDRQEQEYRDYLLGRLPEEAAERLEETMLQEDDVFRAVRSVEDDLFDEIAAGTLNAEDRSRFAERHPDSKSRLVFAQALAARANVIPMTRRRWIMPVAAAATIAVAGIALFNPRERTAEESAPVVVRRVAPPQAARTIVATISIGALRSEQQVPAVEIPSDVAAVELHVRIDPDDVYDHYSIAIGSQQSEGIARTTQAGDRFVVGRIPVRVLADGRNEIAVRGRQADGAEEPLGFTDLEVRRVP